MPAATLRRRSRYDTPAWAEKILGDNPGPAEMDRLDDHTRARRIPRDTDPNTIADDDVRHAFVEQLQDEFDEHGAGDPTDDSGGGARRASAPAPAAPSRPFWARASSQVTGARTSIGSAIFGLVLYAVVVNYVRGGGAGVRKWASAKFTNGGGQLP